MNPITALLATLGALSVAFVGFWGWAVAAARGTGGARPDNPATDAGVPSPFQIAVGFNIQAHHRPMSPNGWSVTIKVPRGFGASMFEVSSASRPGVGWQSGVITIPQC